MDLKTYVSDYLVKFGGSDPVIEDFVIAEASSAKTADQLYQKLSPMLSGEDAEIRQFTETLFKRTGYKPAKKESGAAPKAEKKRYTMVSMNDDDADLVAAVPVLPKSASSTGKSGVKVKRSKTEGKVFRERKDDFDDRWGDESEEEDEALEDSSRKKRRRVDYSPSPSRSPTTAAEESDRERDRKELAELERKMKQRDAEKQARDDLSKHDMNDLRGKSRQQYLRKRETEKIFLLRKQVEQEAEEERSTPNLTKRELREFAKNRELLEIAEARMAARDKAEDKSGFYFQDFNDIDKQETLTKRNKEREGVSDLQLWEEEQSRRAKATSGLSSARVNAKEYEYVFDQSQQIDFESAGKIVGTMNKDMREFEKQLQAALNKEANLQEQRKKLPLYAMRSQLIEALKDHQNMIISSETGSGKSTQVPQYILEENLNNGLMIGVTQPRRVAAMSVAARVAEERGTRLGQEVGYSVRFEKKTSDKTKIKFMTDGMLLRELVSNPTLDEYGVIMLDEAHERTLDTDILLAFLKDLSRARSDLKVIISSATLNSAKFSEFLDQCPIFHVPGRTFPVSMMFSKQPEANYLQAAVTTVFQIHISQPIGGDILVFLTGQEDIDLAAEQIEDTAKKLGNRVRPLIVTPIYSALPSEMQAKIFEPTPEGSRKVVLATNIAETSLTIDGIKFVVDAGLEKQNVFNPSTGSSSLQVTPISRASAGQRAGRAGRTGPGNCLRLYTSYAFYSELLSEPIPEIQRADLTSTVLFLMTIGITDLYNFDFLDPPSPDALMKAMELLYMIGALNSSGMVTRLGRQLVEVPSDVRLAKSIIASHQYQCVQEVLTIVAMLDEAANLFFRPKDQKVHADNARAKFTSPDGAGGDHMSLLRVYNAWADTEYSIPWCRENFIQYRSLQRARLVREQLEALCARIEVPSDSSVGTNDHVPILKALLSGFFSNTATLSRDGQHYTIRRNNMSVRIHPSSALIARDQAPKLPKVVMFHEIAVTSDNWLRGVAPVEGAWIKEVAPFFMAKEVEKMEAHKKKVPKGQGLEASVKEKF